MRREVKLLSGDCLDMLRSLKANSVDACVTDPPYGLEFMGKEWDRGVPGVPYWAAVLRVLKPGGHLIAFGGGRTYHRMACAIEDAGFEIRDQLQWLYGSGFPKSHDVSKGIDRTAGAKREVIGIARGKGGENLNKLSRYDGNDADNARGCGAYGQGAKQIDIDVAITAPATDAARQWQGWGTALKPACEPIVLARKPLSEGTVAANVLKWGTGAINVDGCRIELVGDNDPRLGGKGTWKTGNEVGSSAKGRWPANVLHDGSEEVVALFPHQSGGGAPPRRYADKFRNSYGAFKGNATEQGIGPTSGNAARFFYCAKANKIDRAGSKHPTVKPVKLMRYLVRLVTPPGGLVLDPFAGTGTTGEAAALEGMRAVLIEREAEYRKDIRRRLRVAA